MIPYTPHPILLEIGPVAIRYYSIAYLLGFLLGYLSLKKKFGKEIAEDLLTWIVLATIIGGRIGYFVFYSPTTFWIDPLEILRIWNGGMSFHGAVIALVVALALYAKRAKLSFEKIADSLVVPGAFAIGFGRIANFLNGELVGTLTSVPWCMEFPGFDGCRHPSPLYEAAYGFLLGFILLWQSRKKHQDGFLTVLFVTLYGVFRFVTTFVRDDPRILGLSEGQILSALMAIIGLWFLATKYKRSVRNVFR